MTAIILEIIVLAAALSVDTFSASFAYGMGRIRIPAASIGILAAISSLTLAVALLAGNLLSGLLPQSLTNDISFLILFILGIIKLFDKSCKKQAEQANKDKDNILSPAEAFPLGAALSIDSVAAGIGAGVSPAHIIATILATFLMGIAAILGGSFLGRAVSRHSDANLCWISGVLLIVLAFMKLF